ncbi:hypothetical protein TNCV_602631 [Trichonephila clavipes]|nr:hypothetical protein TNCV_602631 [Trichonephila clavipes]
MRFAVVYLDASHLPSPTSREDFRLDGYSTFVASCHKASIHLQTSMPSLGFDPMQNSTAASFTNHQTG